MFCKGSSVAKKRYERDILRLMAAYAVVLICSEWFVKHDGHEHFYLYFWSVIPALPILGVLARMGRYLQEEKDEYQRWVVMQSILVGAGVLLATLVVNDFLRVFANAAALPPFVSYILFCVGMLVTQGVQRLRNRVRDE